MTPILNAGIRKVYNAKYDWWMLTEDALLIVQGTRRIVPRWYITDGASKPRWVPDLIIPQVGLSFMPAAGHDWLCEKKIVSRRVADDWFRDELRKAGCPFWQVNLMYNYVRLFGWVRYGKQSKALKKYLSDNQHIFN